MPGPRTLRDAFDAEPMPAVRVSDLNDRLRQLGAASTPDALVRDVMAGTGGLRRIGSAGAILREVVRYCPESARPIGADEVVVDGSSRGIRPTPADAVRVLARRLGDGNGRDRARWTRLLHGLPVPGRTVAGARERGR